jgi:hypothetical protein
VAKQRKKKCRNFFYCVLKKKYDSAYSFSYIIVEGFHRTRMYANRFDNAEIDLQEYLQRLSFLAAKYVKNKTIFSSIIFILTLNSTTKNQYFLLFHRCKMTENVVLDNFQYFHLPFNIFDFRCFATLSLIHMNVQQ